MLLSMLSQMVADFIYSSSSDKLNYLSLWWSLFLMFFVSVSLIYTFFIIIDYMGEEAIYNVRWLMSAHFMIHHFLTSVYCMTSVMLHLMWWWSWWWSR